jgi:hypothetical protein
MPEMIKKSLDLNKQYSEARELYIMKDANIDPKTYKFNMGAEVKYEGTIYNVIDRLDDGRIWIEDNTHKRIKVDPAQVTPYRDNYSARMDDKNRFLSSGEFVWANISNETRLCVVSYFLIDDAIIFECLTGKEHVIGQRYIQSVASKDYMLFCNIPSFSKFRKYAVESDAFLERFVVPSKYKYICLGQFQDHVIEPPVVLFRDEENMQTPNAGPIEKPLYTKGSLELEQDEINRENPPSNILDIPGIGNSWNPVIAIVGVVGLIIVINALQ